MRRLFSSKSLQPESLYPEFWLCDLLTFQSESCSVVSESLQPHGLYRPWNSPGQNIGVGSISLLQGIFPTQGLDPGLPHCRQILYQLSHSSVQFSSVTQSCLTLCNPMNCSTPCLPVHHQLLEFTQTHVHRVGDAIQLSHSLSSPSPPAPNPSQHQSLFQWVNSLHEVAKVLELSNAFKNHAWNLTTLSNCNIST